MPPNGPTTIEPSIVGRSSTTAKSTGLPLRGKAKRPGGQSVDTSAATATSSHASNALARDKRTTRSSSTASGSTVQSLRRTSTEEFGHVPFDKFSLQVKKLCEQIWPSSPKLKGVDRLMGGHGDRFRLVLRGKRFDRSLKSTATSNDFIIERLRGGSFNRVVGITVMHSNGEKPTHVVLRVPRWWDASQESEVAILRFVSQYTSIPVPVITRLDSTKENPLKERYVIQSRIYGHDLQNADKPFYYPRLSHEQKCVVARELAQLILSLQCVNHPHPGEIEASTSDTDNKMYVVRPFRVDSVGREGFEPERDLNAALPMLQKQPYNPAYEPLKEGQTETSFQNGTCYFILTQLGRWRASRLLYCPATIGWVKDYDRLAAAVMQMDDLFGLGNNVNCLCHLDFVTAPRNIMVDIEKDGSLEVKAVLDWDSACFAPQFAGCEPPMWLWNWNENDYEDERCANDEPPTPEQREIKQIFEEAISQGFPSWAEYAYHAEFRLARDLFRMAKEGVRSTGEVEEFLTEWNTLYGCIKEKIKEYAERVEGEKEMAEPNKKLEREDDSGSETPVKNRELKESSREESPGKSGPRGDLSANTCTDVEPAQLPEAED